MRAGRRRSCPVGSDSASRLRGRSINRPRVLLLDEPLGALDLKLREEMQIELKAIQSEVGITFIYVTHDQEEALTMSNRLAVFNNGRIEQIGTPADVYEHPATTFVAGFVGTSNLLTGEAARAVIGEDGVFTVRPEKIRLAEPDHAAADDEASARGTVREVVYIGPDTRYIVELDTGGQLVVTQQNLETSSMEALTAHGRPVRLIWKRRHVLSLATSQEPTGTKRRWRQASEAIANSIPDRRHRPAGSRVQRWARPGRPRCSELGEGEGELEPRSSGPDMPRTASRTPSYDWVTPFEDETGCQVNTTDRPTRATWRRRCSSPASTTASRPPATPPRG